MLFQTNAPTKRVQNIAYSMQLELYFKKEYVCEIPSKRLKHFRHILRIDNELAHLLHQVTYVTAK